MEQLRRSLFLKSIDESVPVQGGTDAPPQNNCTHIRVLTSQKLSMKGIGIDTPTEKMVKIKQIGRAYFDS